jgi:hypothetical protein
MSEHTHFNSVNTIGQCWGFFVWLKIACHSLLRHLANGLSVQPIRSSHCSLYFRVLFAKYIQWSKYFNSFGDSNISSTGVTSSINTEVFSIAGVIQLPTLLRELQRSLHLTGCLVALCLMLTCTWSMFSSVVLVVYFHLQMIECFH